MRTLAPALFLVGCTVSAGAPPDAAPCAPSPAFFVSDIWLRYIGSNQCASSGCHAFSDGHGYLRYRAPGSAPSANTPLESWPDAWRDNYLASVQLVRCDSPVDSHLLAVPEGKAAPHPANTISNHALAEQLFRDWVSAP